MPHIPLSNVAKERPDIVPEDDQGDLLATFFTNMSRDELQTLLEQG